MPGIARAARRVRSGLRPRLLALGILLAGMTGPPHVADATATGTTILRGSVSGAAYKVELPPSWNGTLILFSHGYILPGAPSPALALDPLVAAWLLRHGYALAGSAYSGTGWAVAEALRDQIALLDWFTRRFGAPRRTIAWGESLGGLISAGLVQAFPTRFAGALPACGLVGGGVGIWNQGLDTAFALKTLLAPRGALRLVRIGDPGANLRLAQRVLAQAQRTPQGRARLALAASLLDVPGWFDPLGPQPAPADSADRAANQVAWLRTQVLPFTFAARGELERRAGGNPSWNTGVDYRAQLAHAGDPAAVGALYRQAGLSLGADLRTLAAAPRIAADPAAVSYLARNITPTGWLRVPVLTLHTTADGTTPVENERAYADRVAAAGDGRLLRQLFVRRAGHCAFTAAEEITAFQTLLRRVESGRWGQTGAVQALNARTRALGPELNVLSDLTDVAPPPAAAAFTTYRPGPYLRPGGSPAATAGRGHLHRALLALHLLRRP